MNSKNIFIKIDQFIFKKLDVLKNESSILKINDLLLNLSDDQQRIFVQTAVFTIILAPFLFISIFAWSNYKQKSKINIKNQIVEQVGFLNGNKEALSNVTIRHLSANGISTRDEVENKIVNAASKYSIGANKITLIDFIPVTTTSTLTKTEAKIKFTDFGTQDFSNFTRELLEVERFKILKIDLIKNSENNLLAGTIELRHMGKTSTY